MKKTLIALTFMIAFSTVGERAEACGQHCVAVYGGSTTETLTHNEYLGCLVPDGGQTNFWPPQIMDEGTCLATFNGVAVYRSSNVTITRHRCVVTEDSTTRTLNLDPARCRSYCDGGTGHGGAPPPDPPQG